MCYINSSCGSLTSSYDGFYFQVYFTSLSTYIRVPFLQFAQQHGDTCQLNVMRSNIQSGTSDVNDKRIIMGGKFFTQWMGEFTNKYSAATINTLEFD
jgi:hypothetical protein